MRRFVIGACADNVGFESRDASWPDEITFEGLVAEALSCIYGAEYVCIPFKGTFRDADGAGYQPDLAMVARDFSHWVVIEVELTSHSLEGHVLPQVRAFRNGEAMPDCASQIAKHVPMDLEQARRIVEYLPHRVAVVANRLDNRWELALTAVGVDLLTVSAFRSPSGLSAWELSGVIKVQAKNLGFGVVSLSDRAIRLPAAVPIPDGEVVVETDGVASQWIATRSGKVLWMVKKVGVPSFDNGKTVQLVQVPNGSLQFRAT